MLLLMNVRYSPCIPFFLMCDHETKHFFKPKESIFSLPLKLSISSDRLQTHIKCDCLFVVLKSAKMQVILNVRNISNRLWSAQYQENGMKMLVVAQRCYTFFSLAFGLHHHPCFSWFTCISLSACTLRWHTKDKGLNFKTVCILHVSLYAYCM